MGRDRSDDSDAPSDEEKLAAASVPPVPDLALPPPKPRPSVRAAVTPRSASPADDDAASDMRSHMVPTTDLRLDLAADSSLLRPGPTHRVARATLGMRRDVAPEPEPPSRSLLALAGIWVVVLAISGGLTWLVPGGWPIVVWASSLATAPVWMSAAAAGLALVLGGAAFIGGARAEPVSWGMILAGPGLLVDAVLLSGFVVHGLPNLAGSGGLDAMARLVFPWPTLLVPAGICLVALRQAWLAWTRAFDGKSAAAMWVVVAALALFGAVEIARGADAMPPASSLVS